jgi:hypothetical protein
LVSHHKYLEDFHKFKPMKDPPSFGESNLKFSTRIFVETLSTGETGSEFDGRNNTGLDCFCTTTGEAEFSNATVEVSAMKASDIKSFRHKKLHFL